MPIGVRREKPGGGYTYEAEEKNAVIFDPIEQFSSKVQEKLEQKWKNFDSARNEKLSRYLDEMQEKYPDEKQSRHLERAWIKLFRSIGDHFAIPKSQKKTYNSYYYGLATQGWTPPTSIAERARAVAIKENWNVPADRMAILDKAAKTERKSFGSIAPAQKSVDAILTSAFGKHQGEEMLDEIFDKEENTQKANASAKAKEISEKLSESSQGGVKKTGFFSKFFS